MNAFESPLQPSQSNMHGCVRGAGTAATHARILLGAEPPLPPITQMAFSFTAPSKLRHASRGNTTRSICEEDRQAGNLAQSTALPQSRQQNRPYSMQLV
jgi:hypothetical protein